MKRAKKPVILILSCDPRCILIHKGPCNDQGEAPMLVWYKEGKCLSSVWYWPAMMGNSAYNWLSDSAIWAHAERCARQPQTPVSVSRHFLDEVMPAAAKLDLSDSLKDKIERKERQRAELRAMTVTYAPFPGEPAPFAAFVDYADGFGGFETGIANHPVCPEDRKGEGGYLRTIRIRHKLHLGQAAKLIGVTVAQLSSAELGRGGLDPFAAAIAKLEQ